MYQRRFSIVIPTYNRFEKLTRTLKGLKNQDIPGGEFEVIIVDDGSRDNTSDVADNSYPFILRMLGEAKIGPAAARNLGAKESTGQILVFLDDDIFLYPGSLLPLVELCEEFKDALIVGTRMIPDELRSKSKFAKYFKLPFGVPVDDSEVSFIKVAGGLFAIQRDQFFAAGMFQSIGDIEDWGDITFGFRAHRLGLDFIQTPRCIGEHWDYSLASLDAFCSRLERRSKHAVKVLQVYPELKQHLSIFLYSFPVDWRHDPLPVIVRKYGRWFFEKQILLRALEKSIWLFETFSRNGFFLKKLYSMVTGVYIYRGFQEGMRVYGRIKYDVN